MRIFTLVLLSILATAASAEQYLCVADQATGFTFKNQKWVPTKFDVSENKYIIREIENGYKFFNRERPYGVYALGGKYPRYECIDPREFIRELYYCDDRTLGHFFFSVESGRYLRTYTPGYWDPSDFLGGRGDSYSDTPHMEIGRCSEI